MHKTSVVLLALTLVWLQIAGSQGAQIRSYSHDTRTNAVVTVYDDASHTNAFTIKLGVSGTDFSVIEGQLPSNVPISFFITQISGSIPAGYTLDFEITGVDTSDYTITSGGTSLAFSGSAGVTNTVPMDIISDLVGENDETLVLQVTQLTIAGYTNDLRSAGLTYSCIIQNDDAAFTFAYSPSSSFYEGFGSSPASITITSQFPTYSTFTLDISFGGTASVTSDYTHSGTSFSFDGTAGDFAVVPLTIVGDGVFENDETIQVSLDTVTYTISNAPNPSDFQPNQIATMTILNDDPDLVVSFNPTGQPEGNSGSTTTMLSIKNNAPNAIPSFTLTIDVQGRTVDVDGSDYSYTPVALDFTAVGQEILIPFTINGDLTVEADEYIDVQLMDAIFVDGTTDVSGFANTLASYNIQNDDVGLTLTLDAGSLTVLEGDSGTKTLQFTLTPLGSVPYSFTADYTITGTADGTDYSETLTTGLGASPITFNGNPSDVKTFSVTINADTDPEDLETIIITFSTLHAPGQDYSISTTAGQQTVQIQNDDTVITITGSLGTYLEGATDHTVQLQVTSSKAVYSGFTVALSSSVVGAITTPEDYTIDTLSLAFVGNADLEVQIITVTIKGDTIPEPDGTVTVTLITMSFTATGGATNPLSGSQSVTIQDDDPQITFSVDANQFEDSSPSTIKFHVDVSVLSASTFPAFTLVFSVAGSANDPADYSYSPASHLSFTSFPNSQTIDVVIVPDTSVESDDDITITLTKLIYSSTLEEIILSIPSQTYLILNDDLAITLSPASATPVWEQNSGSQVIDFQVSVNGELSVAWNLVFTSSGTCVNDGTDCFYSDGSVPLSYSAGPNAVQVLSVTVYGDTGPEANKDVTYTLQSYQFSSFSTAITGQSQTLVILNDDTTFHLSAPASAAEGFDGASNSISYTISYDDPIGGPFDVILAPQFPSVANIADASDYSVPSLTVSFPASAVASSNTFVVIVKGDLDVEADETIILQLTSVNYAWGSVGLSVSNSAYTILNDDTSFTITPNFPSAQARETSSGGLISWQFSVAPTVSTNGQGFQVDYSVAGSGANPADNVDFSVPATVLTFDGTSLTPIDIVVQVLGDTDVEPDESFSVTLTKVAYASSPSTLFYDPGVLGSLPVSPVVATILNDDTSFTVSFSVGTELWEGNAATTMVTLKIKAGQAIAGGPYQVSFKLQGSADSTDYSPGPGTYSVSFSGSAADLEQTMVLSISGDPDEEINDGIVVVLDQLIYQGGEQISLSAAPTTLTILNDDTTISINVQAADTQVLEGYTGATVPIHFDLGSSAAVLYDFAVSYTISGSATLDSSDYQPVSGQVNFSPGNTPSVTLVINIVGDSMEESDETITVQLTSIIFSNGGPTYTISGQDSSTILNDDTGITITAGTTQIQEGSTGLFTPITFSIAQTALDMNGVGYSVSFTISGAVDPADYDAATSTASPIHFDGTGSDSPRTITINVNADLDVEADVTLVVSLDQFTYDTFEQYSLTGSAQTIIENDDTVVTITPATDEQYEGIDLTSYQVRFTVNIAPTFNRPCQVSFAINTDPSVDSSDVTLPAPGASPVTIAATQDFAYIDLTIFGDLTPELDEQITISLTLIGVGSSSTTLSGITGVFTILNDDTYISITPVLDLLEGTNLASAIPAALPQHTLDFSLTSSDYIKGGFTLSCDLSGVASPGSDYVGTTTRTLTYLGTVGDVGHIVVTIVDDFLPESDESLTLDLTNCQLQVGTGIYVPSAGSGTSSASALLLNDDTYVSISPPAQTQVLEGSDGTHTPITFTVDITHNVNGASFTVQYQVVGASDPADFDSSLSTALVSFSGSTPPDTQQLTIQVNADTTIEPDVPFTVQLTTLTYDNAGEVVNLIAQAGPGPLSAGATILNDDTVVSISGTQNIREGTSGTTQVTFRVSVTQTLPAAFDVIFTVGGVADGSDYDIVLAVPNTVSFNPTDSHIDVTVNIHGDTDVEPDEDLTITLTSLVIGGNSYAIPPGNAITITIQNDDTYLAVAVLSPSQVPEGTNPSTPETLVFQVTSSAATVVGFDVDFLLSGQANNLDTDYTYSPPSGVLSFTGSVGEQKTITITIQGDDVPENDEDVIVTLNQVTLAGITPAETYPAAVDPASSDSLTATGLILNDDTSLQLTTTDTLLVRETTTQTTIVTMKVESTLNLPGVYRVHFSITPDATAILGTDFDFSPVAGYVEFQPTDLVQFITVSVYGDALEEADGHIIVTLTQFEYLDTGDVEPLGTAPSQTLTVTIVNDDTTITISGAPTGPITEGSYGTQTVTLTFTSSSHIPDQFQLLYDLSSSTADSADYSISPVGGALLFTGLTDGEFQSLDFIINGDITVEPDEIIQLVLTSLVYNSITDPVTLSGQATISIPNDDTVISFDAPSFPPSFNEGPLGVSNHLVFTIRSNTAIPDSFQIFWSIIGDVDGTDYTLGSSLPLSFTGLSAGESYTIDVFVQGDFTPEMDELLTVSLDRLEYGSGGGYYFATGTGSPTRVQTGLSSSVTLINDDTTLSVSAALPQFFYEGVTGSSITRVITVVSSDPVPSGFTVDFDVSASDVGVTAGSDYTLDVPLLTFAGTAGEPQYLTVTFYGDFTVEPDEVFAIWLNNFAIGDGSQPPYSLQPDTSLQVSYTILNDDVLLSVVPQNDPVVEGTSGTKTIKFNVVATGNAINTDFSVSFTDSIVSTVGINDYTLVGSNVLTYVGTVQDEVQVIQIDINGDTIIEPDELITITLDTLTYLTIGGTETLSGISGVTTIQNDDTAITISGPSPASLLEGNTGLSTVTWTVTSSTATAVGFDVSFNVIGGASNPVSAGDYSVVAYGGFTIHFTGSPAEAIPLKVDIVGDYNVEADETLVIQLQDLIYDASNFYTLPATVSSPELVILNDDTSFSITITPGTTVVEGSPGDSQPYSFQVTSSTPVGQLFTVDFAFTGSTATSGADFSITTASPLTFTGTGLGPETQNVDIDILGDLAIEGLETVQLTLNSVTLPTTGDTYSLGLSSTLTILDDDTTITIVAVDAQKVEKNSGTSTTLTWEVTSSTATAVGFTIDFLAVTGVPGSVDALDFSNPVPSSMFVTFAGTVGEVQLIKFDIVGDNVIEPDEDLTVQLGVLTYSNGDQYTLAGPPQATTTIWNDDTNLSISAAQATVIEGNQAPANQVTFTITSSDIVHQTFTVLIVEDSASVAHIGSDYTLTAGTIAFQGDQVMEPQTFDVVMLFDLTPEADEFLQLNMDAVAFTDTGFILNYFGFTIPSASITILNDDTTFTITTIPASGVVKEENPPTITTASFVVTSNYQVAQAFTVDFSFGGTADSVDFSQALPVLPVTTLSFAAALGSQAQVDISVIGDNTIELDETVILQLGLVTFPDPSSASYTETTTQTITIQNDDTTITIAADFPTQIEYNSGTSTISFTVTSNTLVPGGFTISYTISGVGITAADYTNVSPATLSFAGTGPESHQIFVDIVGDNTIEPDEDLTVTLTTITYTTGGMSYGLSQSAFTTILNDDTSITISASVPTIIEGNTAPNRQATFTILSSDVVHQSFTVSIVASGAAADPGDYSFDTTTVAFTGLTPNEPQVITATIVADLVPEGDDDIIATIDTVVFSTTGTFTPYVGVTSASDTIVILNDDTAFTISLPVLQAAEGSPPQSTPASFVVTSQSHVAESFTVDFTLSGTATSGSDYSGATVAPLTFLGTTDGETQLVSFNVLGDLTVESDESVILDLGLVSFPSSGTYTPTPLVTGTYTILNDDSTFTVVASQATIIEGTQPGTQSVQFTVQSAQASADPFTLTFSILTASGIDSADYANVVPSTLQLSFTGSSNEFHIVTLDIVGDTTVEADEPLTLSVDSITYQSSGLSFPLTGVQGVIMIENDDTTITFSGSTTVVEGASPGTQTVSLTISSSDATSAPFDVIYSVTGTATATTDYTLVTGASVSFTGTALETHDITFTILGDSTPEPDETIIVTLTTVSYPNAPTGSYSLSVPAETITIQNDDTTLTFTGGATILEKAYGSQTVTLTITSSTAVVGGFEISFSATGNDYSIPTSNPVVFAGTAGETQTIDVVVNGDLNVEPDDIITVNLDTILVYSSTTTYSLSSLSLSQQVFVLNDDVVITVDLGVPSPLTVVEGSSGSQPFSATITSSPAIPAAAAFTVQFVLLYPVGDDGTDYVLTTPLAPIAFSGAAESHNVLFSINGDTVVEADESLTIQLTTVTYTNLESYTLPATTKVDLLIPNDDTTLVISGFPLAPVPELSSPIDTVLTLTVTSTVGIPHSFTVDYTLTGAATLGTDYTIDYPTPLVFTGVANEAVNIHLTIKGDNGVEPDEDVILSLVTFQYTPGDSYSLSQSDSLIIQNDDTTFSFNPPADPTEQDSGTTSIQMEIDSSTLTNTGFTLTYAFSGTASTSGSPVDYAPTPAGSIHFAGTPTEAQLVQYDIFGDVVVETDETIIITLLSMVYDPPRTDSIDLTPLTLSATVTILDDDTCTITITPSSLSLDEGTPSVSPAGVFTFTVLADLATSEAYTVNFVIDPASTANPLNDYLISIISPISFNGNAGENYDIVITSVPDYIVELNDNVIINLVSASSASGLDIQIDGTFNSAEAIILNDDEAHVSINSPTIPETDSGFTQITFRLSLDYVDPYEICDFTLHVDDASAVSPSDYTNPTTITGSFATSQPFVDVPISVNGDDAVEYDETFQVTIINFDCNGRGSIANGLGTGTIQNDDQAVVSVFCSPCSGLEDTASVAQFHVHSTNPIDAPYVTVSITISPGTAQFGVDYLPSTTTLVQFDLTNTDFTLDCTIFADPLFENDETFTVTISGLTTVGSPPAPPLDVIYGQTSATYTILNDDQAQIVLTSPPSTIEGNSGTTAVIFSLWFNAASGQPVEVDFQTTDGTATVSDADYINTSGTVSFAGVLPQETKTVVVNIRGDLKGEIDENFGLSAIALRKGTLTYPISLTNWPGSATIQNDDTVTISISDVAVFEGTLTPNSMVFTISADNPSAYPYTVTAAVNSGSASYGTDFTGPATQNFNFVGNAGESFTFTLVTVADPDAEIDETFTVQLNLVTTGYSFLTLGTSIGQGTIKNDDSTSVGVADCTTPEGGSCDFVITISEDITPAVDIYYITNNLGTAQSPSDFTAQSGHVTLGDLASGGSLTATVSVPTIDNAIGERDEFFYFKIGDVGVSRNVERALPSTVIIADNQAIGTIQNNDPFSISLDIRVNLLNTEGASGSTYDVIFELQITGTLDTDITVDFLISGGTASAGSDFVDPGTIQVLIPQGQTTFDIATVTVNGDDVVESPTETFVGVIQNVQSAGRFVTVAQSSATATIIDDDTATFTVLDISKNEGSSGLVFFQFDFILQQDVDTAFSFDYVSVDGTATVLDDDYNGSSGTMAFAGVKNEARHIFVQINTDTKVEDNEDFTFAFSNPNFSGRAFTLPTPPVGTLINDDSSTLYVADGSITEGDSGTNAFVLFAISTNEVDVPFTVQYTINPGTALPSPDDYAPPYTGTLSFSGAAPGEQLAITVNVIGDTVVEPTQEYFTISLGSLSVTPARSIVLSATDGVGTIIDNDSAALSIDDATANESAGVISFKVNLSAKLPADLTLTWTEVHTTTKDYDFAGTPPFTGTVTIGAGTTFAFIDINLNDDSLVEPTKTFHVVLTPPAITRVSVADGNALGTLTDDDVTTLVFIYDPAITDNGDEDTVVNAGFQVSLAPNEVEIPVQFDFTSVDGTALVSDNDYNTYAGTFTVTLAGGVVNLDVPVNPDTRVEPDETFDGQISNFQLYGQQVTLPGTTSLTFTINNDDGAMVNIVAATAARNEGNSGFTNFLWVVRLDFSTSGPVEVDYQTVDGSATVANLDYQPTTGTVVFAGTGTNELHPIIIQAVGDLVGESDEDFGVQLIALRAPGMIPGTVSYDPAVKSAQITNDDLITVTISDASTLEGNAGTKLLSFTVSVSGPVDTSFTLTVTDAGYGANPATGGSDYTFGGAALTVPAGLSAASFTVSVTVVGDTTVEADEQFTLTVASSNLPSYVTITDDVGVGTIQNDDGISVSITDCSASEGSDCVATVSITADIVPSFTLSVSTLSGTATAGADFLDLTPLSVTVTLGAGTLSVDLPVPLALDGLNELTETFTIALSGAIPSGVTAARLSSIGTIIDNDAVVLTLTVASPITEGDSGSSPMTFTITPSGATDVAVTFDFLTSDVTARAGSDYTAVVGTYTIPANSAAPITIDVPILGDTIVESNSEIFVGAISNVQSVGRIVTIANSAVLGTILDNDQALLNLVDCSNLEGNVGTSYVQMTVVLTNTVDTQISIGWSTQDLSATIADSDYVAATGTVTISGAAGNYYITLSYLGDYKVESDEQFVVNLNPGSLVSNGRNVVVNLGSALATITNDDGASLSVGDVTHFEGSSLGLYTLFAFPVTLSAPSPGLIVAWSIDPSSTATVTEDYVSNSGILQFTATSGVEIQYINIQVVQDTKVESLETVVVTIADPLVTNIVVADDTGVGRIVNDDSATFSVGDLSKLESATPFNVPITLSAQVDQSIDILVTVSDITTDAADYTAFTNPDVVTFVGNAGEVQTFTIPITDDNLVELTETMTVSISIVSNPHPLFITLADDTATVTIQNDDSCVVSIVAVDPFEVEDDPPVVVPYPFEVQLSNPVDVLVTVTITAADLTATEYVDYSSPVPNSMTVNTIGPFAVNVDVLPDLNVELNEQFQLTVSVSNVQGRAVVAGGSPAIGVIQDNDGATVTLNYISTVQELDSTWVMVVQAVLSSDVDGTVQFDYVTQDNTAQIADSDYAAAAGSVVFAGTAGEIKTISLVIYGDTKVESDESFLLVASNLQSAGRPVSFFGATTLSITLSNDDQSLVSVVAPVVHLEGSGANTDFVFTIQSSNAVDVGFTVAYATADNTANVGSDFFALPVGAVVAFTGFASESKTVTVVVKGDFIVEANEQFDFDISTITINSGLSRNVVLGTATRIGAIINDDTATVTVNDQSANEGSDLVFTVRLSNIVDEDVLIAYQVDDITTTPPPLGDWSYPVGQPNPITINAGLTSGTITVHADFDGIDEPTEYFNLRLLSATTASGLSVSLLDFLGSGTIYDQNTASISIANAATALEGSGTSHTVTFDVTLSGNVQGGFVVSYDTNDLLARAGSDYLPASGFLSFTGFDTEVHTVTITIVEDSVVELDESFRVVLSDLVPNNPPRDVTISQSTGTCVITNDDTSFISINDVAAFEGNSGTTNFDFTVSSTLAVDVGFTVPYTVSSGSNNGDLYLTSGQVNFVGAATENQRIRVLVYGDLLVEADELFSVFIGPLSTGGRSVVIADNQGDGTIRNDDSAVVSVSDATAWEADLVITFTVTVTSAVDGGFTVLATTVDGSAKNGIDFNAPVTISVSFSGTLGETQQISIPLIDSLACEPTKTFTLQLTSIVPNIVASSSVTISPTHGSGTGTIKDDDVGNPVDDLYFGATGTTLVVPAPGVLSNDPCTAGTVQLVTNTHLGVLVLNGDGSFSYDSTDCFDDVDFFEYKILFTNGQLSAKAKVTLVTSPCESPYAILYVFTPIYWQPSDIVGETHLVFTATDSGGRVLESKNLVAADLTRGYYLYKPYGTVPGSNQFFTLAKGSNGAPVTSYPSTLTMLLANSVQAQDYCCN